VDLMLRNSALSSSAGIVELGNMSCAVPDPSAVSRVAREKWGTLSIKCGSLETNYVSDSLERSRFELSVPERMRRIVNRPNGLIRRSRRALFFQVVLHGRDHANGLRQAAIGSLAGVAGIARVAARLVCGENREYALAGGANRSDFAAGRAPPIPD